MKVSTTVFENMIWRSLRELMDGDMVATPVEACVVAEAKFLIELLELSASKAPLGVIELVYSQSDK